MKNILISCISAVGKDKLSGAPYTYVSGGISVSAHQTNEACLKYLMKALPENQRLDEYIRVQSALAASEDNPTMKYLNEETESFCASEGFAAPDYCDIFLGEDEKAHRYDRVLSEIAQNVRRISEEDSEISIHLDMAGGKRDNYIFIQLLTKLLSYYGYEIHTYYADITGEIVNTDASFVHMEILDAVNEFVRFGSAARLKALYVNAPSPTVKGLLNTMQELSDSIQLCSTDISTKLRQLDRDLEQVEKNVTNDDNALFVIKTMIPLIRDKFHLNGGSDSLMISGVTRWCLENGLVQQALTIYNEYISDIIVNEGFIVIDERIHSEGLAEMRQKKSKGERNSKSDVMYVLGRVFCNMENDKNLTEKALRQTLTSYKNKYKIQNYGHEYYDLEQTIAAAFFDEKYLPKGITLGISSEQIRKILSDRQFARLARNRVNHASGKDMNDKMLTALFSSYAYKFLSYQKKFTPENLKADMIRAADNLDEALAREKNVG